MFLFLSKVLISDDENMDPADYEMVGVLGRICSAIRAGGTGEMIYSQMGTRRVCGARSEDASAIAKGSRSCRHALRKGNGVRSVVERNVGRRVTRWRGVEPPGGAS